MVCFIVLKLKVKQWKCSKYSLRAKAIKFIVKLKVINRRNKRFAHVTTLQLHKQILLGHQVVLRRNSKVRSITQNAKADNFPLTFQFPIATKIKFLLPYQYIANEIGDENIENDQLSNKAASSWCTTKYLEIALVGLYETQSAIANATSFLCLFFKLNYRYYIANNVRIIEVVSPHLTKSHAPFVLAVLIILHEILPLIWYLFAII